VYRGSTETRKKENIATTAGAEMLWSNRTVNTEIKKVKSM